jgi:TatD DNase family protein
LAWVDSHCHLDFAAFDEDRAAVLQRAADAGVTHIVNPGVDLASSDAAQAQANAAQAQVWAAVGVHPNSAADLPADWLDQLRTLAQRPRVVAVGEIGLDDYHHDAPRAAQEAVLQAQLDLAAELGLPVIIHLREADDAASGPASRRALDLIERAGVTGVLHAFSGDPELAQRAAAIGFWLGIGGPVTFRNAQARQELVKSLPLTQLILETDAPFLAPQPKRGRRNEPAWVVLTAQKIADLLAVPLAQVAAVTTQNAGRLFSWRAML